MRSLFWLLAAAMPALAGESAIFVSGMRLHVDRHEDSGAMVRLYRGAAILEMPRTAVSGFEPDEVPPAEPAAAQASPDPDANKPAAAKPPARDPRTLVREAAAHAGLPASFVASVAKTESAFDSTAVSPKGAIGVMQLMPATAKALGADPNDPAQNIEAGAKLLRDLLLKYDGDVGKALAAYNAGEAAVERYQGVPPYPETQHYVNTVVREYLNHAADDAIPASDPSHQVQRANQAQRGTGQ